MRKYSFGDMESVRSLALPIPCGRIEHVGSNSALDDCDKAVQCSTEVDGLDQESPGRYLRHDCIADTPDLSSISTRSDKRHRPQRI